MARSDTRYSVYPAPRAIEVVGNSAPGLNQAIECWAALLARATADNSRHFEQADTEWQHVTGQVPWAMNEWSLLAQALKGVRFDPEFANPGHLLATAVEDAHRLEYIGAECLDWGGCDSTVLKDKDIDATVKKVVEKLRDLDYVHTWAVIVAVQWFWEHHDEGIDINKDPWWTLAFRRQCHKKHASKRKQSAAGDQRPGGGKEQGAGKPPSRRTTDKPATRKRGEAP
jgi:hypothetical protein